MKRMIALTVCAFLLLAAAGCSGEPTVKDTYTVDNTSYYEMSDGTWQFAGFSYKYRLELSGRMSGAVKDSTFVYLSNIENITFDRAWKAAGLSSNIDDYFSPEEAVLVEWY